jgi:hypothetical protein
MPFVEVECQSCGLMEDRMVGRIAGPYEPCGKCGGEVRKIIGTFTHVDHQLSADREYDAAGPGEKFLQRKQLQDVMQGIQAGKVGSVKVGERWPSALKPKALQKPAAT